jgi:hypothetical protein
LNHSLERSLRLVTPVSGLFIVVSPHGISCRVNLTREMLVLQTRAAPGRWSSDLVLAAHKR